MVNHIPSLGPFNHFFPNTTKRGLFIVLLFCFVFYFKAKKGRTDKLLRIQAGHWWLTPIILTTQEAEIRRILVQSQPGQIVHETLSRKNLSQK
jgi:hypothetical protein